MSLEMRGCIEHCRSSKESKVILRRKSDPDGEGLCMLEPPGCSPEGSQPQKQRDVASKTRSDPAVPEFPS